MRILSFQTTLPWLTCTRIGQRGRALKSARLLSAPHRCPLVFCDSDTSVSVRALIGAIYALWLSPPPSNWPPVVAAVGYWSTRTRIVALAGDTIRGQRVLRPPHAAIVSAGWRSGDVSSPIVPARCLYLTTNAAAAGDSQMSFPRLTRVTSLSNTPCSFIRRIISPRRIVLLSKDAPKRLYICLNVGWQHH